MPVNTNKIRARCHLLPDPAPEVVTELCDELDLQRQELHAVEYMLCKRLGGTVEGQPTAAINYLQRVDELVQKEKALDRAREALHVGGWNDTGGALRAPLKDSTKVPIALLGKLHAALGTQDIVQLVALMQCILTDLDTFTTAVSEIEGPRPPGSLEVRARARATLAALNNSGLV